MAEDAIPGISESDQLRSPERVCEPDPRSQGYAMADSNETRGYRGKVIDDQHRAIAAFQLNEGTPKDVIVYFETAKNLYFYAWFVYRFYPVAEQHALATLEFALRERFPDFVELEAKKPGFGLRKLLRHAINNGYVTNQAFLARKRWAWKRAEAKHILALSERIRQTGADRIEWSDADVVVTQEDLDADWLSAFLESIPYLRNMHAHGGPHLMPNVLHSFEVVMEIINQLYPKQGDLREGAKLANGSPPD